MAKATPVHKWSQRKDRIFLEIGVQDAENISAKIENNGEGDNEHGHIHFSCSSSGKDYELDIELFKAISTEDSKWGTESGRGMVRFLILKKEAGPHWPRLQSVKGHYPQCQVDWSRYVDEDEEDETEEKEFDFNNLGGMGGMGGMGDLNFGEGEEDSDDEEVEGVEETTPEAAKTLPEEPIEDA
mmetsp:Transcript_33481/g.85615  ORF Transcript_33481/g.85615 Transcript_33481/m.85615 type:complete len:184 (-) Transcript_33481:328-879(-)|eukprot:CAMPEP_0113885352 /NCGR_PEP_ID=MMETSP0780_2-20120614/10857_1 /TAXON_ID=652834 /ORGANISM="Palpitomonas bilix" /LENGTH=183 /DNA_ID=CAMNT_0000873257 /DNA_START=21 /DNA_END=572 /DNA_ORIENTATION=+ /assembly_acc=CAM_ASM_000599